MPLATAVSPRRVAHHAPDGGKGAVRTRCAADKLVHLACRRGLQQLGRSRVTSYGRLFEGTDDFTSGQTCPDPRKRTTTGRPPTVLDGLSSIPVGMLQNGWHSERKLLASGKAVSLRGGVDNQARTSTKREPVPDSPQRCAPMAISSPADMRHDGSCRCPQPVDNYVDSWSRPRLVISGPALKGVAVVDS